MFAVVSRCADARHAVFQRWVDTPDLLHDRTSEGPVRTFDQRIKHHLGYIAEYGLMDGQVLSHRSAAAAQRIPLYDGRLDRFSVSDPQRSPITTTRIQRRQRTVPEDFIHASCLDLPGVPMTNPLWTVADMLRDLDPLHGYIAADAYIGGVSQPDRGLLLSYPRHSPDWRPPGISPRVGVGYPTLDELAHQEFAARRARLHEALGMLEELAGKHGIRKAQRLADWATGAAESPLESLTALALHMLGIHDFKQQIVFITGDGWTHYRVDFFIPSLGVIIEADGWGKYRDPDDLRQEKRREDFLRQYYPVIRVEWADVLPRADGGYRLLAKLRRANIRI